MFDCGNFNFWTNTFEIITIVYKLLCCQNELHNTKREQKKSIADGTELSLIASFLPVFLKIYFVCF